MTDTLTRRAGLGRLLNPLAALALLLLLAGTATAQDRIFVDNEDGDDTRTGQTANGLGVDGPVLTIDRALQLASTTGRKIISIEAGEYPPVLAGGGTSGITIAGTPLNGLTFESRPDGAGTSIGNTEVTLNLGTSEFLIANSGFTFTAQGNSYFRINGTGTGPNSGIDFQSGAVDLGAGIVRLDVDRVETTNAVVTGAPTYLTVPQFIVFDGSGNQSSNSLLTTLDSGSAGSPVTVVIALAPVAGTSTPTFTLASPITLGDDSGTVKVQVASNNRVSGTTTIVDGSGGNGTAPVVITGLGGLGTAGDLTTGADAPLNGARYGDIVITTGELDLQIGAQNVTINGGTLDPRSGVQVASFNQTGGTVDFANGDIFRVAGDFTRTMGDFGTAANFPVLVFNTGATATASPGSGLQVERLVIDADNGNTITSSPNTAKTITFTEGVNILGTGRGTGANGDLFVDNNATVNGPASVFTLGTLATNQAGSSVVNGTLTDIAVRFAGINGLIDGTGQYNTVILNRDAALAPTAVADFSGTLFLTSGSLNTGAAATAADFSPIGPDAAVNVNVAAAQLAPGPGISNAPTINGLNFNGDDREYDLTYQDAGRIANTAIAYNAGSEFDTDNIRNLLVQVRNATVTVPAETGVANATDGEISGNFTVRNGDIVGTGGAPEQARLILTGQEVVVLGTTTIEDNATLTLNTDTIEDASITMSGAANILAGTINGTGATLLRNGTTVTGTTAAGAEASIGNVILANGATASLLTLNTITGLVQDAGTGSTLSVSLNRDGTLPVPESAGNITGQVTLDGSTLNLLSGVDLSFPGLITVRSLNTNTNTFFLEGPTGLRLITDVTGTGSVWPASNDITVTTGVATTNANRAITIPTFHPGDDPTDITRINGIITVTNLLRLTGVLEATTNDATGFDARVILAPNATLVVDTGYTVPDGAGAELVLPTAPSTFNFTTNEIGAVNPRTETILASGNVNTFRVTSPAELGEVDTISNPANPRNAQTFSVVNFEVIGTDAQLNLAGNNLNVSGNVVFTTMMPLTNIQTQSLGSTGGVRARGTNTDPISRLSFVGSSDATLTVPQTGSMAGNGVDIAIDKEMRTGQTMNETKVTLLGGPFLFDDEFDLPINASGLAIAEEQNDETLFLIGGILVAGQPEQQKSIYIRLDHENSVQTVGNNVDNGQGFVIDADRNGVDDVDLFPESFIAGNVMKRIANTAQYSPGRVIYPTGEMPGQDADADYAPFTFDFQSGTQNNAFPLTSLLVSFVGNAPGGNVGLPIVGGAGTGNDVNGTADFYWLISTLNVALGQNTIFNVEARSDDYMLNGPVQNLRLVKRQQGDATTNPYTLIGDPNSYANFTIDPDGVIDNDFSDDAPVVLAQNAQTFLGPQGTIVTYGTPNANTGGNPNQTVQLQFIHEAPSAPSVVDVYVNDVLVADNLAFGQATSYRTISGVTAATNLRLAIAPETSTSSASAIYTQTIAVQPQGVYAEIIVNDGSGVRIVSVDQTKTTASSSQVVEARAFNASPDAGTVTVGVFGDTTPDFASVPYATASPNFVTLDPATIQFQVGTPGNITFSSKLDLASAAGERGLLILQGLKAGNPSQQSRNLNFVFVRPGGQVIRGTINTDEGTTVDTPTAFALAGNFPNPFNAATTISFDLPEAADVTIRVFDVTGREVMTMNEAGLAAGADHKVRVDAGSLAAGLYVYQLTAEGASRTFAGSGRMTITR